MAFYLTSSGDTLDYICWKHYQHDDAGVVELVLKHNQNLSFLGEVYSAGLLIDLPEIETDVEKTQEAGLW